ncbi:hypothetical protein SAMN05444001_102184 [Parabacteroides chinchillae]|uniref:Uncharacterized protein n=1 Tax=Parabacteroides chinchillae TaxID=871327 RepID=A0A8G2BUF1_9BACT|nr:hypothetical protein SAMN05444001_102184 [Parabacteroides chinchillae]
MESELVKSPLAGPAIFTDSGVTPCASSWLISLRSVKRAVITEHSYL